MLHLLRWPNGDFCVLDTDTLLASAWLTSEPSGSPKRRKFGKYCSNQIEYKLTIKYK
jgi:hypothetical protein